MILPPEDFTLEPIERASPLWLKLERFLQDRLDRCRERNDVPRSELETSHLRGEIAALKALLRLGQTEMPPKRRLNEAPTPEGARAQ